jgi:hypothetical protein
MIALLIADGLQPPQQGFHEVPQEIHRIFQTLTRFLINPAGTKVVNLGQ